MIMKHMGNGILCKYYLRQKPLVVMGVSRSESVLMDPGRIKWQKIHSVKTNPHQSYITPSILIPSRDSTTVDIFGATFSSISDGHMNTKRFPKNIHVCKCTCMKIHEYVNT